MEDKNQEVSKSVVNLDIEKNNSDKEKPSRYFNFENRKLSILIVAALAVIIFVLIAFTSLQNKNNELRQKTIEAYQRGDFAIAEQSLKNLLKSNPNDATTQSFLIKSIASQGNSTGTEADAFKRAQPYIESSLKSNPNNTSVLIAVGYAYETSGQYATALTYYDKALTIDPNNSEALFHKGHNLEFLGRFQEAVPIYKKALQVNSTDPLILFANAKIELSSNNIKGAIDLYKKAGDLSTTTGTNKAEALTNVAYLSRMNGGNFKDSFAAAKEAYESDNSYAPAVSEYGFDLGLNNQLDEGIVILKKAIELNPRISQSYLKLAALYRLKDDFLSAIPYNEEAVNRIDQDNTLLSEDQKKFIKASYQIDLAYAYDKVGRAQDALPVLTSAIKTDNSLKKKVQSSVDYGSYKTLVNNPEFNALLK